MEYQWINVNHTHPPETALVATKWIAYGRDDRRRRGSLFYYLNGAWYNKYHENIGGAPEFWAWIDRPQKRQWLTIADPLTGEMVFWTTKQLSGFPLEWAQRTIEALHQQIKLENPLLVSNSLRFLEKLEMHCPDRESNERDYRSLGVGISYLVYDTVEECLQQKKALDAQRQKLLAAKITQLEKIQQEIAELKGVIS